MFKCEQMKYPVSSLKELKHYFVPKVWNNFDLCWNFNILIIYNKYDKQFKYHLNAYNKTNWKENKLFEIKAKNTTELFKDLSYALKQVWYKAIKNKELSLEGEIFYKRNSFIKKILVNLDEYVLNDKIFKFKNSNWKIKGFKIKKELDKLKREKHSIYKYMYWRYQYISYWVGEWDYEKYWQWLELQLNLHLIANWFVDFVD